jgi:hypothetical protein
MMDCQNLISSQLPDGTDPCPLIPLCPPNSRRWPKPRPPRPNGLSGNSFRRPGAVRRAHVGELREQVFVGPDLILCHLSI